MFNPLEPDLLPKVVTYSDCALEDMELEVGCTYFVDFMFVKERLIIVVIDNEDTCWLAYKDEEEFQLIKPRLEPCQQRKQANQPSSLWLGNYSGRY